MPPTGDVIDLKHALRTIIAGPIFVAALTAVIAEKGLGVGPSAPRAVYTEERLTKLTFPMCELIAYHVGYKADTMVKEGTNRIGIRWTVVERDEETATLAVEILVRATVDALWDNGGTKAGFLADWTLGSGPVNVVEEDYSPLVPNPTNDLFQKAGLVVVEIESFRDA